MQTQSEEPRYVRLHDVPKPVRERAARRYIRQNALEGHKALELLIAALRPQENPGIWVTAEEAARVFGASP